MCCAPLLLPRAVARGQRFCAQHITLLKVSHTHSVCVVRCTDVSVSPLAPHSRPLSTHTIHADDGITHTNKHPNPHLSPLPYTTKTHTSKTNQITAAGSSVSRRRAAPRCPVRPLSTPLSLSRPLPLAPTAAGGAHTRPRLSPSVYVRCAAYRAAATHTPLPRPHAAICPPPLYSLYE